MQTKTLVILLGPTGVGKTDLSIGLAERLGSPVISADSRQIYSELPIGTAAPTAEQQARVKHYFIGTHSITDNYSAGQYETDCLRLLDELFTAHDTLLLTGGSMMYIDAVCRGFDDIPAVADDVRRKVQELFHSEGLEALLGELQRLDPEHYERVDRQNHQRVMRALEVCYQTGQTYSSFRSGVARQRPFRIVKIGLNRPRAELYERINRRVDIMLQQGLLDEVRAVMPFSHLNSLNTVGYKELFPYLRGEVCLEQAVEQVKTDSRRYAKRQLTWFRADSDIRWLDASQPLNPDDIQI